MGRAAAGVRGINLRDGDNVVGMDLLEEDSEVLMITENGYGKRTPAKEYAIRGRGGKGVKTANVTEKNGPLIGLKTVDGHEDIMLITNSGVIIRFHSKNISQTGRATQGVRLMRLEEGGKVSTLAKVEPQEEIEGETAGSEVVDHSIETPIEAEEIIQEDSENNTEE